MAKTATYEKVSGSFEKMNDILEELHEFISSLYRPKFLDEGWAESIQNYSQELSVRVSEISKYYDKKKKSLNASLTSSLTKMEVSLNEYSTELMERPNGKRLHKLYESMQQNYEELLVNLKNHNITQIKADHLKPTNYARNLFHIVTGLTCTLLYQFVLGRELALMLLGSCLALFGVLEITRRFSERWNTILVEKVFGIIARPHERHKTNGSTYYVIAMFLLVIFFPKPVVLISVLVLGFADPAASIIGKLWGRRKLFKKKSFMGTGAFLIVSFSVTLAYISLAVPNFSFLYALLIAAVISIIATATELFSIRVDDNLSVPLMSAIAAIPFF